MIIAVTGTGLGLVVAGSDAAHGQNRPPPPGGMGAIAPQGFDACEGHAAQDACPITQPDGISLAGQCSATPDEKPACMPDGDQPPPPRT